MNERNSGSHYRRQKRIAHRPSDDRIHYLLSAEEQILQSISARAPLPEILNGICSALDCQIGNVVSLISLPRDEPSGLAQIAMNANLFGLYSFCFEEVGAEDGAPLAYLEMYSCFPQSPSASELQLVERAKCLAALAIQRDLEAECRADDRGRENPRGQGNARAGSEYVN